MGRRRLNWGFPALFCLLPVAVMREFLDVVDEAVEFPLRVDFLLPAQSKAIELFVVPEVAEDRFDGGKALAVFAFAFFTVDGAFHLVGKALLRRIDLATREADLPHGRLVRMAQTLAALEAGATVALRARELGEEPAVDLAVRTILVERFAGRAEAGAGFWIPVEITGPVALAGFAGFGF